MCPIFICLFTNSCSIDCWAHISKSADNVRLLHVRVCFFFDFHRSDLIMHFSCSSVQLPIHVASILGSRSVEPCCITRSLHRCFSPYLQRSDFVTHYPCWSESMPSVVRSVPRSWRPQFIYTIPWLHLRYTDISRFSFGVHLFWLSMLRTSIITTTLGLNCKIRSICNDITRNKFSIVNLQL